MPHMVVGLTIVAFGTSAPELAAGIGASLRTTDADPMVNQLALGAVIGSNIANIGLILAVGAMLFPIVSQRSVRRRELPLMLVAMGLGWAAMLGGSVGRVEGALLVAGVLLYTWHAYAAARRGRAIALVEPQQEEQLERELAKRHTPRWWVRHVAMVSLGIVGLAGGAELLVRGSVAIAEALHVPQMVIGLTMVAVGTSLPELATSVSAARRKHTEILLGNVIGSNVFNTLCVLGVTAVIRPVAVERGTLVIDAPVMMGMGALAWLMVVTRRHMGRVEGTLLLAAYAGYVAWLVVSAR